MGRAAGFLLKACQTLQNKSARIVTKLSWYTPTRILLQKCDWLSVNQLVFYHTVLCIHKSVITGKPRYMNEKLCAEHDYNTRNMVIFWENFSGKSALASNSFCYRGATSYNSLPPDIRETRNEQSFKRKLKKWTKMKISIDWCYSHFASIILFIFSNSITQHFPK